jgi:hypothetical protein
VWQVLVVVDLALFVFYVREDAIFTVAVITVLEILCKLPKLS